MALWYVDSAAAVSGNGTSWATAWKAVTDIAGIAAGDTVYFSGGASASNSTKIYLIPAAGWSPPGGTPLLPITYAVGQIAAHNGMVWFKGAGYNPGQQYLILNPQGYLVFTGYWGVTYDPMQNSPPAGVSINGTAQHMMFGNSTRGAPYPAAAQYDSNWGACFTLANGSQSNGLAISYCYAPAHFRFVNVLSSASQTGLTIDHCYLRKAFLGAGYSDWGSDTFYLAGLAGGQVFLDSGCDIHHNYVLTEISSQAGSAHIGDDVVKWGTGFDFHHNHCGLYRTAIDPAMPGRADYIEANCNFTRIYANWFDDIGASVFFHNSSQFSVSQTYSDVLFCNNLITQTLAGPGDATQARGLDFLSMDAAPDNYVRFNVVNNLFCVPYYFCIRCGDGSNANTPSYNNTWNGCRIENNIFYNCPLGNPGNDASTLFGFWSPDAVIHIAANSNYQALGVDFVNYDGFTFDNVSKRIVGPLNFLDFQPSSRSLALNAAINLSGTAYPYGSSADIILSTDAIGASHNPSWTMGAFNNVPIGQLIVRPGLIAASQSKVSSFGHWKMPDIAFPLKVSTNGRYLTDQGGLPIFLAGDAAWGLMANASASDRLVYLQTRSNQGFNCILFAPFCDKFLWGNANGNCQSFEGLIPFATTPTLTTADLSSPNEAYWQTVDLVVQQARSLKMAVILAVADTAAAGVGGWNSIWTGTSTVNAAAFGTFLGNRYNSSKAPNVMWLLGGDYQNWPGVDAPLTAFAAALRTAAPNQLMSWELDYQASVSTNDAALSAYTDFNWGYTYFPAYQEILFAYQRSPVMPVVLGRAVYEQETYLPAGSVVPVSTQVLRLQTLWAVSSGACGHIYGSSFTDKFGFGAQSWQGQMSQPSSTQFINLIKMLSQYPWYNLVPDTPTNHNLVTAGYGTPYTLPNSQATANQNPTGAANTVVHSDATVDTYCTGSVTPDGQFGIVAVPNGGSVTVNLAKFSGPVTARWYDASNDTFATIGSGLAGSQSFTAPPVITGGGGGSSANPYTPANVPAATYFVSQNGSGTGDGSSAANSVSVATFNGHSFGVVPAGGVTVQFNGALSTAPVPASNGNASGKLFLDMRNATLSTGLSWTSKSYITLLGNPAGTTSASYTGGVLTLTSCSNVQVDGWAFLGNNTANSGTFAFHPTCTNIIFSNCKAVNCGYGFIGDNTTGIVISGCDMTSSQTTADQVDLVHAGGWVNVIIERSKFINRAPGNATVRHNDTLQCYFGSSNPTCRNWEVRYNWIENDNRQPGSDGNSSWMMMEALAGPKALNIHNNVFTAPGETGGGGANNGIRDQKNSDAAATHFLINNTIIQRADPGNVLIYTNTGGYTNPVVTWKNNILWVSSGHTSNPSCTGPITANHNCFFRCLTTAFNGVGGFASDPLLVNPTQGVDNYSLQATSPCRGAADNTVGSEYQTGLVPGCTWPNPAVATRSGAWDMGAFVYGAVAGGGPPTGGNSVAQPDFLLVLTLTTPPKVMPGEHAQSSSGATVINPKRVLRPMTGWRKIN